MQRRNDNGMFTDSTGAINWREVYLCITIFIAVVALLFPLGDRSRPKARRASCMSNMKQIGLALIGYAQDYDDKFPTGALSPRIRIRLPSHSAGIGMAAIYGGQGHGLGVGWAGSTFDYVKTTGVFHCPDDKTKPIGDPAVPLAFPISYAMNEWIAGQPQSVLAAQATTVLAFECSRLQVNMTNRTESGGPNHSAVGDGASDPATGIPGFGDGYDTSPGLQQMIVNNRGQFARHDVNGAGGGASMYLLADGHVKFLRYNDVSVGKQPVSQSKLGDLYKASFNTTN